MRFLWLYQIPVLWLGILVVGFFVVASITGMLVTRPIARKLGQTQNDFANFFLAIVGVFYAVLMGLIAVACWGNYTSIAGIVSAEAVSADDVYRDIDSYPPQLRDSVRAKLRTYMEFVIREEWPAQHLHRNLPNGGEVLLYQIARELTGFQPENLGQQVVHGQTLRDLDDLFSDRRLRSEAIDSQLPGLMWAVVLMGTAIMIFMTYFFYGESRRLHILLTAALGAVTGLMIFLILALDRPLVGRAGIGPDSFQESLAVMNRQVNP